MKINLNETIRVKLTPLGQQIYRGQWEALNNRIGKVVIAPHNKTVDEDGYSSFQLWEFIETFGSCIGMGKPNVIQPLEIIFEQEATHD